MSKTNKTELEKLQVWNAAASLLAVFFPLVVGCRLPLLVAHPSPAPQEAFYNFDEEKQGYLSIDDLRYIVTSGEQKKRKTNNSACC